MNRCPKCKNTLSSSDVLCPRCGAMVEEINTKVSINNYYADKSNPNNSESTTLPDDYDNIIMYNESFPMTEQEPKEVQQDQDVVEEPEDFDIEKIISTNGASDHVNPLLAHVKKQQTHVKKEPQQTPEPIEKVEPIEEVKTVSEVDLPQEPEEAEDIMDMVPSEGTIAESEPVEVAEPTAEDESQPALNELEKIVKELTQSQDKRIDEGFSIDDTPSYSKLYLEALRNIDIAEDENEDSYFDPDAYMEQYRQSKKVKDEVIDTIEPELKQEEPLKRRYNPNKPKSDKEELLEEIRRIRESSDLEDESVAEPSNAEQEVLDLELDPHRFNMPVIADEQEVEEEQFVVDEDEDLQSAQGGFVQTEEYTHKEVKSQETILDKVDSAAKYTPAVKTKKRLPIWAAVLIWIAVAGGVFLGAYTFDNYVKKTYSGYNEYIYEITDGKISIESIFN